MNSLKTPRYGNGLKGVDAFAVSRLITALSILVCKEDSQMDSGLGFIFNTMIRNGTNRGADIEATC